MTNEEKKKLYAALSAPFPAEAIERTEGRVTGRGYDTSGIKYQYVVNRLNEILGLGGYRTQQKIDIKSGTNGKGRTVYDATCEITVELGDWKDGMFEPFAEGFGVGGHTSMNEADARKGAFTNGFKKCAAMFGCGAQAYMGTLDDDAIPDGSNEDQGSPSAGHFQRDPRPEPPSPAAAQQRPQESSNTQRPMGPVQTPPQRPTSNVNSNTGAGQPQGRASQANQANSNSRNRLTTKQLAAIWALARKLNMDQRQFREDIKRRFNCQPEFLDKNVASTIIGELAAKASNGAVHPATQPGDPQGAVA